MKGVTNVVRTMRVGLVVILVLGLLAAGCGGGAPAPAGQPAGSPAAPDAGSAGTPAAASPAASAPAPAAKTTVVMTCCPAQGTWYPVSLAIEKELESLYPNLDVQVIAGGGAANIAALQEGKADIGFALTNAAFDGLVGNPPFNTPADKLRELAVLFPQVLYVVVPQNSSIQTLADAKGKRVNVGTQGSATAVMGQLLFREAGLQDGDVRIQHLGEGDAINSMKDGHLDMIFQNGSLPYTPLLDLAAARSIRFIPITADLMSRVRSKNGGLMSGTIPASAYPDLLQEDVPTIWTSTILLARADVPAETAAMLAEGLHKIQPRLQENFAFMQFLNPADLAADTGVPFHPGAEQYYRSQGWLK